MATGKINPISGVSGKISPTNTISGSTSTGGAGSGVRDHDQLENRNLPNQHPISAITGLTSELASKLDSKTALPLIEEAVKNKAKGLYFDANKELAKKAYWYLTSEIDPVTKMGTKTSIISGPYDLGAGGGGGGGGTTEVTLNIAIDPETGKQMWPYNVSVGGSCVVGVNWSSLRDGKATGRGTMYAYVEGNLVETRNVAQGLVTFDFKDYINAGANKVEIKVIDAYSTTKNLIDTINGVTLKLTSNFIDDKSYEGDILFTYTPIGAVTKTVHFILDGDPTKLRDDVVDTTGEQRSKVISRTLLSHGAHSLRVYFDVTLDGEYVKSNELYFDIIWCENGNKKPIIATTYTNTEEEQYAPFNVRYRVFTPGRNKSTIRLVTDSESSGELSVDQKYQNWNCRFDDVGNHTLQIVTGTGSLYTEKTFSIHVHESEVHVEPVTEGLELFLTSFNRHNTDAIDVRRKWDYTNASGTIHGELNDKFNWSSNGWCEDSEGNTVLRLSGDARAVINFTPFSTNIINTGKTFEFEIATSDVKAYDTRIMECLDGSDAVNGSQGYAGEDTRQNKFVVKSVNKETFLNKLRPEKPETYVFVYNGEKWNLDDKDLVTREELETEYGIVLEETPSVAGEGHFIEGDRVIVYYTVDGHGFYLTPQLAKIQSQQSSLSTQYKENDRVRLTFVIEQSVDTEPQWTRLIYMYINGILSGVTKYPDGDSFQQLQPYAPITLGSNNATLDVYNIRVYNQALTRRQVVNNWIADTRDPVLKAQRFKKNDNYDDNGNIIIDQDTGHVKGLTTPYMVLTGPKLPDFKKDRQNMFVKYVNPADDDRNFTSEDARVDVQGTSSQYYYKKNFKIKFEKGFDDKNGNHSDHYKLRGEDSKKEKTFTFKADVASSEGANNVELVRYFEDTKNWWSPAELEPDKDIPGSTDSKKRIRVGIDGFPIIMFHKVDDTAQAKFYGKMNFNNDKGNDRTFGFDDGDECWEFVNNSTPQVLFKSDDLDSIDSQGNVAWQSSFEGRFPEEAGPAGQEHPWGTEKSERAKLQSICTWIVSTNRAAATGDELDEPVTYDDVEYTHDTAEYRLAKFKAEFDSHFDRNSSLFYYLYTELFLMVDSRAKNAMLTYLKSRQTGDGGNKWFWFPYDMDTALGINNEGLLVFNYDKEDTDKQEGANVFNGQDSVFWNNLRDSFGPELKKMYTELRAASGKDKVAWSYENAEKYFEDHQDAWSESIFNEDAYSKYLEPYFDIEKRDATYLGMAQGSKLQQRRWWMYNRFRYLDSKYSAGDALKDTIMFRAYIPAYTTKPSITVTPYSNLYVAALYKNGDTPVPVKVEKGKAHTIPTTVQYDAECTDQETIIYSASQLSDIGDLSPFKPGYADFSKATKLQTLTIGSSVAGYNNPYLKWLNVGANHLLTKLDARNCTALGTGEGTGVTPTIDLSQCFSIEEVYFDNTQIKGVSFPDGGNLHIVHLPETLTSLTIRNHPNITDFQLAGTDRLTSLWLENIPASVINPFEYVTRMPDGSNVRLIGINDTYTSEADIKTFYDKLDKMKGCQNKDGKAEVTGTIHVNCAISYAGWLDFTTRYPEIILDTSIYGITCAVRFYAADRRTIINTQAVLQGASARFPGTLNTEPSDWSDLTDWDWEDGYIYDEVAGEFVDAPHTHYVNYYKSNRDTTFSLVEKDTEFESDKYYEIPEKACTDSKYYVFNHWDKSLLDIQTDMDIYPIYDELDRHYIIESDTHTLLIWAIPRKEDVVYGHYAHRSALSEFPSGVTLIGWREYPSGDQFTYEGDAVGSRSIKTIITNTTIRASFNDSEKPAINDLSRVDYKTVHYNATDNVGIIAYAITNTETVEESDWIEIESTPEIDGTFEVTHAGLWYFWIKDNQNNINEDPTYLTCYSIIESYVPGIDEVRLVENGVDVGDFALSGTITTLEFDTDFHYEFLDDDGIFVNGLEKDYGDTITVNSNIIITTAISPRKYTVRFNLCGKGDSSKATPQTITYLHHVERPIEQYYHGYVIGTWYLDSAYTQPWDFENDVIDASVIQTPETLEIMMYAEWNPATEPTKIDITVPATTPAPFNTRVYSICEGDEWVDRHLNDREVMVALKQPNANTLSILWGDEPEGTEGEIISISGEVRIAHQYAQPGDYTIQLQKRIGYTENDYLLGERMDVNAVNPSIYITDVTFAFDIQSTSSYAFQNTSISNLKLTPYMTKIETGAFCANSHFTEVNIPYGITLINDIAFDSCSNIERVTFPETLTFIGIQSFGNCSSLTDISTLENTHLNAISYEAFRQCTSLREVILPSSLLVLGGSTRGLIFRDCYNLKHVVIKNPSLLTIGYAPFGECRELKTAGPIGSGCDIEFAWTTSIPNNAFGGENAYRSYIESVIFPTECTYIGNSAFKYSRLSSVELPAYLEHIGKEAFANITRLTRIKIPTSVSYIGEAAFAYDGLRDIELHARNVDAEIIDDLPADRSWFWGNQIGDPNPVIHVFSGIEDVYATYGQCFAVVNNQGAEFDIEGDLQ